MNEKKLEMKNELEETKKKVDKWFEDKKKENGGPFLKASSTTKKGPRNTTISFANRVVNGKTYIVEVPVRE